MLRQLVSMFSYAPMSDWTCSCHSLFPGVLLLNLLQNSSTISCGDCFFILFFVGNDARGGVVLEVVRISRYFLRILRARTSSSESDMMS